MLNKNAIDALDVAPCLDGPMRAALAELKRMRTRRASRRERQEYLSSAFGEEDNPRAAVTCLDCEDSGLVEILAPETIVALRRDPECGEWRTCVARCSCDAAERYGERFRNKKRRLPVFGERAWHIAADDPDAAAKAAGYESRPDNYYEEFGKFK